MRTPVRFQGPWLDSMAQICSGFEMKVTNLSVLSKVKFDFKLWKSFTYDYSYCSFDPVDSAFADQKTVYKDLGDEMTEHAFQGGIHGLKLVNHMRTSPRILDARDIIFVFSHMAKQVLERVIRWWEAELIQDLFLDFVTNFLQESRSPMQRRK